MPVKFNAHLTAGRSDGEARLRIEAVEADGAGVDAMAPKMRHYSVKLEDVPTAGANIIKQGMLSQGGDAAESVGAYASKAESTDMIIMGTLDQLNALATKVSGQPFGLSELALDLPKLLENAEKQAPAMLIKGGELGLSRRPLLMGIINCTPDSFYDGGKYDSCEDAINRGRKLIEDGADILDIGGESTRPGSEGVSESEEIERVLPVIKELAGSGVPISIDTMKKKVAEKAIEAGAVIINDVSALSDPGLASLAAESKVGVVLMHMLGTPRDMQKDPTYGDLFGEIIAFLRERIDRAVDAGVEEDRIAVDPGIGFGKTVAHNLELIRDLWRLRSIGRPVLLGPSNKSFIGKVLGAEIDEREKGTAAALVAGVLSGAHILRVHDVGAMKQYVEMAHAIRLGEGCHE